MKKIFLIVFTLRFCCVYAFSQAAPKFDLTKDGVAPVVLTFDAGLTAEQIYARAKSWNASSVNYPASVIRAEKENALLKFAGHIDNAWKIRDNDFDYWYTLEYTLNVEIKDGRCRVTFETPDIKYKVWYNPDSSTITKFKDSEDTFEASINKLLTSLNDRIKDIPKKADNNW